jgi:transcriptional regulator with XRE-family HTH domain
MNLKEQILKKKGNRSWTKFAKDTGVTRQSLLNYMTGKFQPRYETLNKLSIVLQEQGEDMKSNAIQEAKPTVEEIIASRLGRNQEVDRVGFDITELSPRLRQSLETIQRQLDRVGKWELQAPLYCKAQDLLKTERQFVSWLKTQDQWLKRQPSISQSKVYRIINKFRERDIDNVAALAAKSYLRNRQTDSPSEWLRKVATLAEKLINDELERNPME